MDAVARLNAKFGAAPASDSLGDNADDVVEKIGINNLTGPKRFQMTKKLTIAECMEKFGVRVTVKGVYVAPDTEIESGQEPIYLELRGNSLSTVNACGKYLRDLQNAEDSAPSHIGKVMIPLSGTSPFGVVAKIVGPGGEFVKHIKRQANCQVQVAGKNCGLKEHESDEELHVRLEAHSADGLTKAKELTQSLVDHVMEQYQQWLKSQPAPPPPSASQYPTYPAYQQQQQQYRSPPTIPHSSMFAPPPPPASKPQPPPPPPPPGQPETKRARMDE